jgi:hypothetical protein
MSGVLVVLREMLADMPARLGRTRLVVAEVHYRTGLLRVQFVQERRTAAFVQEHQAWYQAAYLFPVTNLRAMQVNRRPF